MTSWKASNSSRRAYCRLGAFQFLSLYSHCPPTREFSIMTSRQTRRGSTVLCYPNCRTQLALMPVNPFSRPFSNPLDSYPSKLKTMDCNGDDRGGALGMRIGFKWTFLWRCADARQIYARSTISHAARATKTIYELGPQFLLDASSLTCSRRLTEDATFTELFGLSPC